MFETFPPRKHKGDPLTAEHINMLTAIAQRLGLMVVPANVGVSYDNHVVPFPPFRQFPFQITGIASIEDDDIESSFSSSSSSSPSSESAASDESSESSNGGVTIFEIKPRYFDHTFQTWFVNTLEGPFELDASAVDGTDSLAIGDNISAYWHPGRVMWVPVIGASTPAASTCDPRNEIWVLTIGGIPTSGTFDIENFVINEVDEIISGISANATAAQVKTALEGHSEVEEGDIETAGGPLPTSNVWIEFVENLEETSIINSILDGPRVNTTSLIGGSGLIGFIDQLRPGYAG